MPENRYSLEDVKDLLRREDSPFRIYEDTEKGSRVRGEFFKSPS